MIAVSNTQLSTLVTTSEIEQDNRLFKILAHIKQHYKLIATYTIEPAGFNILAVFRNYTSLSFYSSPPSPYPSTTRSSRYNKTNNIDINKDKLVHSSFRIKEEVIKSLEVEAKKRGVSISSLVNKTLENYVTSEMYFEELGFMLVSKEFLRKTFDKLDEKHLEVLGRELGITVAREYISYFFPEVNGDSLLKFLDLWFRRFQSYQHKVENERHYYMVNHDINVHFSIALRAMLEGLMEPILKSAVDFRDMTSNAIAFSFKRTNDLG